jgi:hypothetical protein
VSVVVLLFGLLTDASGAAQSSFDVKELAAYRLTGPVFERFEKASRRIADVTRSDAALARSPLFTKEITLSGDAPVMAAELEARLKNHPALAGALHSARIAPRDYARFAVALFAARLAHGFVKAGVLRSVPTGVAADNVAFVAEHHTAIEDVLTRLGVEF